MLRQSNPIYVRRCLFAASAFWVVFIIIYISCESFYESKTAKEIWSHLKFIDRYLQSRDEVLGESRSQVIAENSTNTSRLKQDRLLPLKIMFENAGKQDRKRGNGSLYRNSIQVPLADLRERRSKLHVLLLVIVTSASHRQDRRNAIRNAWWQKCIGKVCSSNWFLNCI